MVIVYMITYRLAKEFLASGWTCINCQSVMPSFITNFITTKYVKKYAKSKYTELVGVTDFPFLFH